MTNNSDANNRSVHPNSGRADDEIDLMALVGTLWEGRWLILMATLACTLIGAMYALLQPNVYRANTLIQVEEKQGALPGMEDLSGLLESASNAGTEIQLIKSRRVLGEVVGALNLDIVTTPNYFPVIGEAIARRFQGEQSSLAPPLFGSEYAWGAEELTVTRMEVPAEAGTYVLRAMEGGAWQLLNESEAVVLYGDVGKPAEQGQFALMVTKLHARPGTLFRVTKRTRLNAIMALQKAISASEKGQGSGIIELSYENTDPVLAEDVLDEVGNRYVRQNVERNSAEAAKSLKFLRESLPELRKELEDAERKLNQYQINAETIDITAESTALLEQIVALETRISELEIQRAEIEQRFQPTHPRYKAWASQMAELKHRRQELDRRLGRLPETQQKLVRLRRDVEVGNKIYLQMLSNIQQLDIARAGTVGNVRVVDEAVVDITTPVAPKRVLITAMALMLGGMIGVGVVFVRSFMNRGVENPDEIERIGLPIYASIPRSETQDKLAKNRRGLRPNLADTTSGLLAVVSPADLAVESLRSLRTSLHFGMMDAKNNILMISGPSPGVGKTFVSANLAAVMAMANQRVLLVDADMRRGLAHNVFGVENKQGLSDLLAGQACREDVLRKSEVDGLSFITRGTVPPNPSELLMSKRFNEFLASVSKDFDLVIVDTPPLLAVTDAAIVGRHAGASLLVAWHGVSPLKEIEQTKHRFEQNGIDIRGVVLNAVVKKSSSYQYGYYQYEYASSSS
ncbi:polysaccharide biosynthesis tyrosine autokinase [Marinobacter salinisoli]|uniref:Polysaccharide biosynthesis tyrosine autokinase n=1 Tax=Marinobacter salinisoli TaxID=2769486 RepID=A0ABX7MW73_9GAMM|nr:polysaccharide biosynthesis tyrosine autokinase [Marinobacter salinisoli]QSP94488.1 polysaccharide biosynthesis tyrosine autokinase [Marinobacter salinisoli]